MKMPFDPSALKGAFKIRLGSRSRVHEDAHVLVKRRYGARGYAIPDSTPGPGVFTFMAYDEGRVVGTIDVRFDSEQGLSADELCRGEVDHLRAAGHRLCEFIRLAVDRNSASKRLLAGLFHTAYLFAAKVRLCTHAVIEVNPRHAAFYARELGFESLGPERLNTRVMAPAVPMCVSFEAIAKELAAHAGTVQAPGVKRTLFHYGFPTKEEAAVTRRLRELTARG